MKLWHISQDQDDGYDTYDSAVVAAETSEEAANTHPTGDAKRWQEKYGTWCSEPSHVTVRYLADYDGPAGVICASFNAG